MLPLVHDGVESVIAHPADVLPEPVVNVADVLFVNVVIREGLGTAIKKRENESGSVSVRLFYHLLTTERICWCGRVLGT